MKTNLRRSQWKPCYGDRHFSPLSINSGATHTDSWPSQKHKHKHKNTQLNKHTHTHTHKHTWTHTHTLFYCIFSHGNHAYQSTLTKASSPYWSCPSSRCPGCPSPTPRPPPPRSPPPPSPEQASSRHRVVIVIVNVITNTLQQCLLTNHSFEIFHRHRQH